MKTFGRVTSSRRRTLITVLAMYPGLVSAFACASARPALDEIPLSVDLTWHDTHQWSDSAAATISSRPSASALVVTGYLPAPTQCGTLHAVAERGEANHVVLTISREGPGPGYGCLAVAGGYAFSATVKPLTPGSYRVRVHYIYYRDDKSAQLDRWIADKELSLP